MADENKPIKYMRYAIGEIVLVVIGILIALQINNWNAEYNTRMESEKFKERLLLEIKDNIQIVENEIQKESDQISSSLGILNMFGKDASTLSSRTLDSLMFICMTKNEIDLKLGTFSEGLNTGKIALIALDSLRSLLYGLPAIIENVKHLENVNNLDIGEHLTPFLYRHLNWRKMDSEFSPYREESGATAFTEFNSLDALNLVVFENLIDNRFFNSKEQVKEYLKLRQALGRLEQLLEK